MEFELMQKRQEKVEKIAKASKEIILIVLVILIILEFYNFFTANNSALDINYCLEKILVFQLIICVIMIVIINIFKSIYIKKLNMDYLEKYLFLKDSNAILHFDSNTEIVSGNLKNEGCIRRKNIYMIESPKYKCILKRFDDQELKSYHRRSYIRSNMDDRDWISGFEFVTIDSVIEFSFEILDNSKYYPMLYHILKDKFNDSSILDNKIIIKQHLDSDVSITDVIDNIEKIYYEIIKIIGEENTNVKVKSI